MGEGAVGQGRSWCRVEVLRLSLAVESKIYILYKETEFRYSDRFESFSQIQYKVIPFDIFPTRCNFTQFMYFWKTALHVSGFPEISKLCKVASRWKYISKGIYLRCTDP